MINTFQTSLAPQPPPPVPPRHHNGSHPILIPTHLPSQSHSKSVLHFLVGMVLLHLFLSIGGFIYLSFKMNYIFLQEKQQPYPAQEFLPVANMQKGQLQEKPTKAFARMLVLQPSVTQIPNQGYLLWDKSHSDLSNISLLHKSSRLEILKPGKYHVYSKVTFSKSDSKRPLASKVMLRKSEVDEEKPVMMAYCSLDSHKVSFPNMCTAMQGEILTLEKGNQLSIWVQDTALVDYEEGATTFGIYEL
ncbi:CD40 ligand [Halichoeres trimaculatus]|uniref:CD40 ligand n=1 Tax=Halichoeres trimaculatus TaxID=147232 RepID=UPI003D9F0D11